MRFLAGALFAVFFGISGIASAQSGTSEFNIRVFGGSDTEPPTTPTLLAADAVSPNQVNLSWSTSTDNFALGGYIVERSIGTSSTSTIATTTLTTFSDTGLSASTTYAYSVRAFDTVGNYSSSSNMISVTTPNPPVPVVPPPPPDAPEGTVARVVAEEIVITSERTMAFFDIATAFPARLEIKWGRTGSYELGYISSDILRREYSTMITGLEPGTTYEYEIIGYTPIGRSNVVERGQFRTLDDLDLTAPANVRRFLAEAVGVDVRLSWDPPAEDDIAFVRIVRSHLGYPVTPTDGALVYQGMGRGAVDAGVLLEYSPAYYTAFVYDTAGNVSSGAIAIVFANDTDTGSGDGSRESVSTVPLPPLATTTQHMPDAFEILIKQADREASFGEAEVLLDSDEPFLIQLLARDVTQNLKSIIVQVQDPTDQRRSFSFLLRLNKDQTAYEAVVAPLEVVGTSATVLSIYDFRALRVAEYRTVLSFEQIERVATADDLRASDTQLLWRFLFSILLLLLLLVWWLIAKDRDDDEDDEDKEADTKAEDTV